MMVCEIFIISLTTNGRCAHPKKILFLSLHFRTAADNQTNVLYQNIMLQENQRSWLTAFLAVMFLSPYLSWGLEFPGPSNHDPFFRRNSWHLLKDDDNNNDGTTQQHGNAEVVLGTTLVAIRYDGGVVVGADTRTSVGGFVSHRVAHKINRVAPRCVMLRSGSAADTQQLASDCLAFVRKRHYLYPGDTSASAASTTLSVSQIAHWLRRQIRDESQRALVIGLIVAGYDHEEQEGKIFSLSPSGTLLEESQFAVSGSGSSYIVGFLDRELEAIYHEGALPTLEQALYLCKTAVKSAIDRDGSSGGLVRICTINKNGVVEETVVPKPPQKL